MVAAPARRRTGPAGGGGRRLARDGAPDAQKNALKPHPSERWCLAPTADPAFGWYTEDVLGVYARPDDPPRPVVFLDETSRRLLAEPRHPRLAAPSRVAGHDPEYVRGGVANVFLPTELLRGWREALAGEQRTRLDWARWAQRLVDVRHPDAERIAPVIDQLTTHALVSFSAVFPVAEAKRPANRLEVHRTPKHGSWLNMAEIEPAARRRHCLRRRLPDLAVLGREVTAWGDRRNRAIPRIGRRFTTADARTKLQRLYHTFEA